ncbi:MAG: CRISPR-associated protein Cas5 [Marinifilaceae bacterium]|jgi:CRISPR-associated protein Cas5 subtype I-B|nr:CRISPR-associated protein Cas5 [Marinifilaceae bacterium]
MKAIQLEIKGNWAQFRKAETNNNPLSHDLITKTALIGMIGAVIGKDREQMKELFPVLSEDLLYSVQINNAVIKQSWGFTLRNVNHVFEKSPKQMEFIKNPNYTVIIVLGKNRSIDVFEKLTDYCKNGKACFTPVLGLHNCPAEICFIKEAEITKKDGEFSTKGFMPDTYEPIIDNVENIRIGFDKIPTYQNNDFWNVPDKFVSIVYPSDNSVIKSNGVFYEFNKESQWCLI